MTKPALPSDCKGDEKSIELIEMLLRYTQRPFDRMQFSPGHITATGLVLHPDGESIALVFHRRLERWLLPGGHVEEGDGSVEEAAAREVWEETGLSVGGGKIVGADVHGIPPKVEAGIEIEPYHQHHDILVAFYAQTTELTVSEESREVRWVSPAEFSEFQVPANSLRAYRRSMTRGSREDQFGRLWRDGGEA